MRTTRMMNHRFIQIISRNIAQTAVARVGATTVTATTTKPYKKPVLAELSGVSTNSSTLNGYTTSLNKSLKGKTIEEAKLAGNNTSNISSSLNDINNIDWSNSWYGLGMKPFNDSIQEKLLQPLEATDIEIKPDGLLYLPEIKYRRILNKAFGAGGWGLVPRSETIVTASLVTREYGLICNGQLVGVARGEQDYFNENGIPTATEGCKSNALMRCCKDLGIGSELWDPVFITKFKETYCIDKFVEHVTTKRKKKIWLRKDRKVEYPYK